MTEDENQDPKRQVTMAPSAKNSKFQYQKEVVYNKLLPYARDIETEARTLLSEIKANLGRSVMLREIMPGCTFWSMKLWRYLELYGLMFDKKDHITFIKLLYELVTIPNLEPHAINIFAMVLNPLLKKKQLIAPDELELPWKPLYDVVYRFKLCSQSYKHTMRYPTSKLLYNLDTLVRAAKIYFPLGATEEILRELRPRLCPIALTMVVALPILECFLPIHLPPERHRFGYQLWFDEFMSYWQLCHNAPSWEGSMMEIMAKLANNNIGYIDWEVHLPLMFTRLIQYLNLPVVYKKMQHSKHNKVDPLPIAMWIVSVLGPNSSAQMYLEKFLKTIETYLHPANVGRWQGTLKDVFTKLSQQFILRLHRERYAKPSWITPIPEEHKLRDSDVDAFVKSMMPVAMRVMFSRLEGTDTSQALQYLATIRPNLVLPEVLERLYSTLDSLTEPHKLISAMQCIAAVARPMVQGSRSSNKGYEYPEGPADVIPLLFSLLPGIDPNDPRKCFVTFRLISIYANLIPFVDSSRSKASMTDEEREICEATSKFEDFVLQFFDRIFMFIDFSSLEFVRPESCASSRKSKAQGIVETILDAVCIIMLIQTSDKIFECALHKLRDFVAERNLETNVAGQLAAVVCQAFSHFNGRDTLRALFPILSQSVLDSTADVEDVADEENLDNRLLYSMLLLSAVVDTPGNNLLPYTSGLSRILDRVLALKSTEGNGITCRLLTSILSSLTTARAHKFRYADRDFNDPDYPYVRDWGQGSKVESVEIQWFIPGEEEIAEAKSIFFRYFLPEMKKLERYCEDCKTLSRKELLHSLNIVASIIVGSESILPVWAAEPPLRLVETCAEAQPFLPTLGVRAELTMPDGGNVKLYAIRVMSELQKVILRNAEDDTKSMFVLVEIWTTLLLGYVPDCDGLTATYKALKISNQLLSDKLVGKKDQIGSFILKRVEFQHALRVESQCHLLTETHKRVMLELFTLATSRYADVRSRAQTSLFSGLQYFPHSYKFIVPNLIEIMKKDTQVHHDEYKGLLYLLFGPQKEPLIVIHEWETLRSLWPAVVLCKLSEKLSVVRLREKLIEYVRKFFRTSTIRLRVPDRCVESALGLWANGCEPSRPPPNEDEIRQGSKNLMELGERNRKEYRGLLDDLLRAILEKNLHWRHRQMAMTFIKYLAHPDEKYPANVVQYFLGSLVHDSLDERKLAIITVGLMLSQQKPKHPKIAINVPAVSERATQNGRVVKYVPGQRSDNSWLQYDYDTRPLSQEEWDKPRFVHKSYIGYYAWPETLRVHAPSSHQPCLDPEKRQLTDHEREVDRFFNDPRNVEKLIGYLSLEEKKGEDVFSHWKFTLFRNLFCNHGIVYLKHFLPHLERLITDKQESSQRCASEIIAGLISGTKHWPYDMVQEMWIILVPIIRLALSNLTTETIGDWCLCFAKAQANRDPNRYHWLFECLMEEPLTDSESSFLEGSRLHVLQWGLDTQCWRVSQLLERLLKRLEGRLLLDPFEFVRDRLSSVLVTIFKAQIRPIDGACNGCAPNLRSFMEKIVPRLLHLADENSVGTKRGEEQSLSTQVANVKLESSEEVNPGIDLETDRRNNREKSIRLLKAICTWIRNTAVHSLQGVHPAFFDIFPILCLLENSDPDEEVSKACTATLAALAQALILPNDIPTVLETLEKISKSSSWGQRSTCLQYLQVLVFRNMSTFLSEEIWAKSVTDIVLQLLEDERLEVREDAANVLGGLLHCEFIPNQEKLLEEFRRKANTNLHKKKRVKAEELANNNAVDLVRIRHGGVLGLCAYIQAHPYDIPEHILPIFEWLALHMHDPQPIPLSIRRTLANFKRTHYDSWTGLNGCVKQFIEEQLAVLQGLAMAPSHYA